MMNWSIMKMKDKQFISNELRAGWAKVGFDYYHTLDSKGLAKDVFFINHDTHSSITFKHGYKGRMLLDTKNLTIDEKLEGLIENTRKELGLK